MPITHLSGASFFKTAKASSAAAAGRVVETTLARSRRASSTSTVGRAVEVTINKATQASSTASVDRSVQKSLGISRQSSSKSAIGRSVSVTTKRVSRRKASNQSAASRSVNATVERQPSYVLDLNRTRRWKSKYQSYSDLDGADAATAVVKASLDVESTGVLMEAGATGDGLAMAVTADTDVYGNVVPGTQRVIAMFGNGGKTGGADVAKVSHRVGLRFTGVDVNGYDTRLYGDWRSAIEEGHRIGWSGESGSSFVDGVSYDASGDYTTVSHREYVGYDSSKDAVYIVPPVIRPGWSAGASEGECVLYLGGAPVDTSSINNSRLCGGNPGTIGDYESDIRELGQGWSGSDYEYDSTVFRADIYVGQTTPQVTPTYKSEGFVDPEVYRHESREYRDGKALGRRASAFVGVELNQEDGIIAHWGAGGDGAILYLYNKDLYLQVGDGGTEGGSAECVKTNLGPGAHIIEWTADIDIGELRLRVDGVDADSTPLSYGGELAGTNPDGIGESQSNLPVARDNFYGENGAEPLVQKAETFVGESWLPYEQGASSSAAVGRSVAVTAIRTYYAQASSSASVAQNVNTTVSRGADEVNIPSSVFGNLGSELAIWDDSSQDYSDLNYAEKAAAEVSVASFDPSDKGLLMESGAQGDGLALYIDSNQNLRFLAGQGDSNSGSDVLNMSYDVSGLSGNHTFGWSANKQEGALYVDGGSPVKTQTYSLSSDRDLGGGNNGTIGDTQGGERYTPNLSETDYKYDGNAQQCYVWKGSTTEDVGSEGGSDITHDFESGSEGWTDVETFIGRTTAESYGTSSYSYGGGKTSAPAGELAYAIPSELSGGNQISALSFYWIEKVDSYGGMLRLLDSSGITVIGTGTNNPQWDIVDGSGSKTEIYDGGGNYQDWIKVDVTFDWSTSTADVTFTNTSTGKSVTESAVSTGGTDVEKIQLVNYQGGNFGSGDFFFWIDDLSVSTGGSSSSGPSFSSASFTKYGDDSAEHSIDWTGGTGPFTLRIYESSAQYTLLHSSSVSGGSDNEAWDPIDYNDLNNIGGTDDVYFVLQNANQNKAEKSVDVFVSDGTILRR